MKKRIFLWVLTILVALPISAQVLQNIDEIAPFSEGLAAVRKGQQWGFINEEGKLVIEFRDDIYTNPKVDVTKKDVLGVQFPMFNEGLCLIKQTVEDGVPVYGFIDKTGAVVIKPQFLNIYPFKDGYTTGVLLDKTVKGENEFKLDIYEYKFFDVKVSTSGEITDYFENRDHILMTIRRYTTPTINAKLISTGLVALHTPDNGWTIKSLIEKK